MDHLVNIVSSLEANCNNVEFLQKFESLDHLHHSLMVGCWLVGQAERCQLEKHTFSRHESAMIAIWVSRKVSSNSVVLRDESYDTISVYGRSVMVTFRTIDLRLLGDWLSTIFRNDSTFLGDKLMLEKI